MLRVSNAAALGTTAGGTTIANNAALELYHATGVTIGAEALTISGTGVGLTGVIRNILGDHI